MKLEGSYEVKAPRAKVWSAFLDPETLRKAIPGCEKLEMIGPDEYKATLKIGVAAVKGTFEGKVRLLDKKPSDSYRLAAVDVGERNERIGPHVTYSADVQVGGLIAGVGQRMLGGVSKMMADQFFNRMSEQLSTA